MVAERRRRFRLRVSRAGRGARAEPEGALVFLGLRPLHPRPGAGSPRPQAAAIDFDGRHRRRRGHGRRQAAAAPRGGRLVAQAGQVGAGFLGEALDVAAADAHARHRVHGGGHAGAGGALAGAGDAAAAQVRGVAVAAPARAGPPGEKIPAAGRAVADGRGAGDRAPQAVQGARRAARGRGADNPDRGSAPAGPGPVDRAGWRACLGAPLGRPPGRPAPRGEQVGARGWAWSAESAAGNGVAPPGGEITERLAFLGGQRPGGQELSYLGLAPRDEPEWSSPFDDKVLRLAKTVLTSDEPSIQTFSLSRAPPAGTSIRFVAVASFSGQPRR